MGHQGHASEQSRLCCEWIWDGAIGPVREVHIWSNRPTGSNYLFPCGTERPEEQQPIPEGMNWDLWIGPAPYRPYHRNYAPMGWRAYYDFGSGPLGDMGCHQIDPIYWALKLNKADTFEVQASKTYHTQKAATETYPVASIVRYSFPARDELPPVEITWYDGGMMPPIPEEMAPDRTLPVNGAFVIGDKGILMNAGTVGAGGLRLIPEEKMQAYNRPAPTLKRSPGHHKEWVQACKTGEQPGAHFGYSGPLAEIVLVGCLAIRMADPLPVKLQWDKKQMRVTNVSQANEFLHYPYRQGWFL
jgi:hypothetical protein